MRSGVYHVPVYGFCTHPLHLLPMLGQVDTALVLAGGKGERLRPLTDDRPKPMVEVGGRPILEHHLRWLRSEGIIRAVLLTGYLGAVVEDYFSVERVPGLHVECVRETSPLGRGGAIRNGWEQACAEAVRRRRHQRRRAHRPIARRNGLQRTSAPGR